MINKYIGLALAGTAIFFSSAGHAQNNWPQEPIKIIVAYPPGGSTDTAARLLAKELSDELGQSVVVENRGGAGGTIGAAWVSRAKPDGHTIIMAAAPEVSIAPVVLEDLAFDAVEDFAPISLVGKVPFLLAVNPQLPLENLQELVEYAKENPGQLNYSSFGTNTSNHLVGEQFKLITGIDTTHVPYKGSGPSIVDLIAGEVQYTFDTVTATLPHVQEGRLKALATATLERLKNTPDIPTVSESGWPGFVAGTWFGLLAPAGTPEPVIRKLNTAVHNAMQAQALQTKFTELDIIPAAGSPQEFANFISEENQRWQTLMDNFEPDAEK